MHEYNTLSDGELLTLLSQGNAKAFEAIYKRYVAELFRYARKNISTKEECEEIVQEIFESLWHKRQTQQILNLRYYLVSIVRYKIIKHIQQSTQWRKYALHYKFFESVYDGTEQELPSEVIQSRIVNAISQLPERCQVAIKLRLFQNLSNTEIAHHMNITKKTVEVYMVKAFSHLRSSRHQIFKAN
jgi:RNA polymerase sigma-70 factor (family 1)